MLSCPIGDVALQLWPVPSDTLTKPSPQVKARYEFARWDSGPQTTPQFFANCAWSEEVNTFIASQVPYLLRRSCTPTTYTLGLIRILIQFFWHL